MSRKVDESRKHLKEVELIRRTSRLLTLISGGG